MHHYYIAYVTREGRYGGVEIKRPTAISGMTDIEDVTADLRSHFDSPSLVAIGFSKFEEGPR